MNPSQLKLNVYARYVNVFVALFFVSEIPMPADKRALLILTLAALGANAVLHLFAVMTGRYQLVSFLLLGLDMATIIPAIYLTGLVASPFVIMLPISFNVFYYLSMSKRTTFIYGCACVALITAAFALWWHRTSGAVGWDPHQYPVFTFAMFGLLLVAVATLIHQSTFLPSPLLSEIHRQEISLVRTRHQTELGAALAMVAHEIRNPLTTIKLAIELSRKSLRKPPGKGKAGPAGPDRHLKSAAAEAERIEAMMNSLLSQARDKADRLNPVPCRVGDLIDRAIEFITMKHGRSVRPAFVRTDDGDIPVRADPDAIQQVLVNLLNNSVEARAEGRQFRVEVRAIRAPGRAVITLRDNGKGIPAEVLARLFERFSTGRREGTGLGLAICQQIMEKSGGKIDLHSTPGAGTTAVLTLPLAGRAQRRK
jgi:signal transduction histidine kinase